MRFDADLLLEELGLELLDQLVHHLQDHLGRERVEGHPGVEAVSELRAEGPLDGTAGVARVGLVLSEPHPPRGELVRPGIGGEDEHHVAEVGLAADVVGEGGVVHHLQQQVEDVGVGLLDLVEEEHGVGGLADRLGEEPTLVEAHIARGGADEPRDGVLLLVLRHVEAEEVHPEDAGGCLASSVLPTPVGPEKRKLPMGRSGAPRPERESLMALAMASMAVSCP